jgi:hypothetical protein
MDEVLKAALEENPIGRKAPLAPPVATPPADEKKDGGKGEIRA